MGLFDLYPFKLQDERTFVGSSFELGLTRCPVSTAFDAHFVELVKVVLHRDAVLCNVNQMVNIGIFKDSKVSSNVFRL